MQIHVCLRDLYNKTSELINCPGIEINSRNDIKWTVYDRHVNIFFCGAKDNMPSFLSNINHSNLSAPYVLHLYVCKYCEMQACGYNYKCISLIIIFIYLLMLTESCFIFDVFIYSLILFCYISTLYSQLKIKYLKLNVIFCAFF